MKHKPGAVWVPRPETPPSPSKGKRDRHYGKRLWFKVYRQRIIDGLEKCRQCGCGDNPCNWLTFDHVLPSAMGHNLSFDNATILCEDCNADKADQLWPHLITLAEEEAAAPREHQWLLQAQIASHRASTRDFVTRGLDGSDVTLKWGVPPWGARCCECQLRLDGKHERFDQDLAAMLAHIGSHRAVGDRVPEWVDHDVRAAIQREAS